MKDNTATFYIGDACSVLATLPDHSIDLALFSPPFLNLRDYLPSDDPAKAFEIGTEGTPAQFIDSLLDVVEAITPKLAPHGSLAVELGDTYAGSGGAGGDYNDGGLRDGQQRFGGSARQARKTGYVSRYSQADGGRRTGDRFRGDKPGWPLDKSLCLIPEAFRMSLVYGFNVLSGPRRLLAVDDYGNAIEEGRDTLRWRGRNVVRWARPNPPVGALSDKFRPGTSDMIVACQARDRYFDLDAVRRPPTMRPQRRNQANVRGAHEGRGGVQVANPGRESKGLDSNPLGAPPLDWWDADADNDWDAYPFDTWVIPTEGYEGSHYATWPTKLLIDPIEAMCPRRVCTVCGKPSRRIIEAKRANKAFRKSRATEKEWAHSSTEAPDYAERTTVGWTDCECDGDDDRWRPGVVLDCFAGSGTTLMVAHGMGRSAIGIDLDKRNADLAASRLGMFLTIASPEAAA